MNRRSFLKALGIGAAPGTPIYISKENGAVRACALDELSAGTNTIGAK